MNIEYALFRSGVSHITMYTHYLVNLHPPDVNENTNTLRHGHVGTCYIHSHEHTFCS